MAYKRYGDEWEKEVLRNPKKVIVVMLRNVAKERDDLYAAQQGVQSDGGVCTCRKPIATTSTNNQCGCCGKPRRR